MASVTVARLRIDDDNIEKFAAHGISDEQVDELVERPYVVLRNRGSRRAPFILIGRDASGQCIAVPIEPTEDAVVWRPVTAWYCKQSEWARLPRER